MDIYRFTYPYVYMYVWIYIDTYKYIHQYWQISEPYAFTCLFSGKWYNYHICTYTHTHHTYCIYAYTYTHQNMTLWYVCPQTNHTYDYMYIYTYIWHATAYASTSQVYVTWLICTHDMSHPYAWHDSFIRIYYDWHTCMTRPTHKPIHPTHMDDKTHV